MVKQLLLMVVPDSLPDLSPNNIFKTTVFGFTHVLIILGLVGVFSPLLDHALGSIDFWGFSFGDSSIVVVGLLLGILLPIVRFIAGRIWEKVETKWDFN